MFKKILIISLYIVLSNYSFASKSSMNALGQNSDYGSLYIYDIRTMFSNPAILNVYNNLLTFELGDASSDTKGSNAEGGVVFEAFDFIWGIYFGSDIRSYSNEKKASGFMEQDNRIDIFFAGDAGFEWDGTSACTAMCGN